MRKLIAAIFSLAILASCADNADKGQPQCKARIFIETGEGTYDVDSVSERFKTAILQKYPGYPYAKECRDSAESRLLYNILDESDLLRSGKILSIQLLPKVQKTVACEPFMYKGIKDSLYWYQYIIEDTNRYCTRKYNYQVLGDEPIHLVWQFAEPKRAGTPRYKELTIFHRSGEDSSGSTLIARLWYRNF